MMKLEDIKIGMKIWTMGHWTNLPESGTVTGIGYTGQSKKNGEPYAMIDWDNIGSSGALLSDIYPSLKALQQGEKERMDKAVTEMKSKIHDVKDLVTFMYHATLNGEEYTNYDERRVARECAKELLGLDLEE